MLCAVFRRWLAASRLAARFARVSRFARLFVTLTSVRGGIVFDSFQIPTVTGCGEISRAMFLS